MSLLFAIGAIIGSSLALTVGREPAHRAWADVKAKLAKRGR
jgi:hypothetical protein